MVKNTIANDGGKSFLQGIIDTKCQYEIRKSILKIIHWLQLNPAAITEEVVINTTDVL